MLLSMNWISDFVDLSGLDKVALIKRFSLSTAEVEDIIVKGADTYGVIVARIASVENHPNSKKLHLLKVDTGSGLVDCVCGAPNVREGMKVAFAQAGGSVCGNAIGEATVAGYKSFGMCCSEAELGISADHAGLMELPEEIALGTDIKSVYDLDDIIFEVDNKSLTNRPDLWGHFGIAREFATLADRSLKTPALTDTDAYRDLPAVDITIAEPTLCYRYIGIKADNIKVKVSPVNMRIRLYYCGSRAINLLADLTNYVMMELGQPMHAFDLRRADAITVRRFETPFSFKTLDGQDRVIDENTLMICKGDTPVAVAGVMGGLDSEIEDDTDSLLLESACFDGVGIRKTSTRLGLRTDASMRYEKMLDPELPLFATRRLLALLLSIDSGARVISSLTDVYAHRYETIKLSIDKAYVDRYTGIDISADQIEKTLVALGFGVARTGDVFDVTVPSWRATKDVTIKADLIEEITRIYGYDNFAVNTTKSPLAPIRRERTNTDDDRIKDMLVASYALHEVHSYIWCDAVKYKELGIEIEQNVKVINAQTPDHATLRYSMVPTLLSFLNENRAYADSFGIFEIGRTVNGTKPDGTCDEHKRLGIALFSRTEDEETLYLRLRDIFDRIARSILHKDAEFAVDPAPRYGWQHPVNTASVSIDGKCVGFFSVPHPAVGSKIDKKAAIAFGELDMEAFSTTEIAMQKYAEPSKFPGIDIDLSFRMTTDGLVFGKVADTIRAEGGDTLTDVYVVDIYHGEDGDSVTVRMTFQSNERTLSKAELQPAIDKIVEALAKDGYALKL